MSVAEIIRLWLAIRPIRRLRQRRKAKGSVMTSELILAVLRHGLTYAGGAGMFSDSELTQLAAGLATVIGLVWSGYRKWKRSKAE